MAVSGGSCSRKPSSTKCFTVVQAGASFSTRGNRFTSKQRTLSAASLMIQVIWSGKRRGFTVWQTRPVPEVP